MDRIEVHQRWNACHQRSPLQRMPQWFQWRVTKKIAKWSGRPRKQETKLFWGQMMTIVYPEYVSSKIGRHGYFENDLTSMFLDVLQPGMVVYDVGSHFGYFSLLASELVGETGHVFAFEPTRRTFDVLQENASRRSNITCNNLAAFRESGEIRFCDQGLDSSSINFVVGDAHPIDGEYARDSGTFISVPAVSLDDFSDTHPDPDFLKIDAEGAEGPILEGMTRIIECCHPGISLEMGDQVCQRTGNAPCRDNLDFLLDQGYEVLDYRTGKASRHVPMEGYGYDNLLFRHPQWRETRAAA